MNFTNSLRAGAAALALSTAFASLTTPVLAQQTTGAIRGVVTNSAGVPIAGATVTVVDTERGFSRTVETNSAGVFSVRNLSVSGNYTVVANDTGFQGEQVDGVSLSLGDTTELSFSLDPSSSDDIVVIGTRRAVSDIAIGPNSTFGLETLQTAPAINRNITDVLRIDPRVYVDESRGDVNAIQCAGQNPRFNSLTVDGVRLNDSFGLNSNGYPTERIPFSYDAIEQVSVELAPFDVEYGGFTACNINAVTKSGTNEIHGAAFFDYTSEGLRGNSLEGQPITVGEFDEWRYGAQLSGPIIKDQLFFFVAYEKLQGANLFNRGAQGTGAIQEVAVSQADLDEIVQIANDVYNYDPGEIPNAFSNDDEKILVKLDWLVSDNHRANFVYNYNEGFNIVESDGDLDEFEFSNHLYERGSELHSFVGSVYSDWTDNFSTELRISYLDLDNRQECLDGGNFGEMRIDTGNVDVYIGCDDSRHANDLNYDVFSLKAKADYTIGGHNLTFGFERESLDIFNLFIQHAEVEYRFDSIDDFRIGFADRVEYANVTDGNSAAAEWGYALNTLYAQDEFEPIDGLTVVAGVRYDFYTTSDAPPENPDFTASYGFPNTSTLDGNGLVQPRFAFTYDAADNLVIRGGAGLYSGGNPNVWVSNNFSNNNVTQVTVRGEDFGLTASEGGLLLLDPSIVWVDVEDGLPVGPGYGVPEALAAAVRAGDGGNFEINYLDPDFDLPAEWKFALGATYVADLGAGFLGGEYVLNGDLLWSRGRDSAIVLRADLEQTGTTADGYPIFDSVNEPAFVLTNSTEGNRSFTASMSIAKSYDNGIDWTLGYAYNDSEDVNPMTSSVAFSNYTNRGFFDPQEQVLSRSNYNIEHRITATVNWEKAFWGDNYTRVSLFGSANSGQPYSIAETDAGFFGFTPFVDDDDANILLAPGTRNVEDGSWWGKVDFKIEQEIPGVADGHKAKVFMVIDNVTNLLNDEWGVLRQVNFPNTFDPTPDVSDPDAALTPEQRIGDASLYEVRFGVRYEF